MESTEASVKFYSKVVGMERKRRALRTIKVREETIVDYEDSGWFMHLDGSWESIYVGHEKVPPLSIGDEVEVIIRRRNHGQSSKPSK